MPVAMTKVFKKLKSASTAMKNANDASQTGSRFRSAAVARMLRAGAP
jgi:hypothetical protein